MDRVRGAATDAAATGAVRTVSPKRMAREAARGVAQHRASTRAEEALRLELGQRKQESRTEREAEAERKRLLRRAQAKERHRGH